MAEFKICIFQSEIYSSMTSHDSSIVSADLTGLSTSSLYHSHKDTSIKELLKHKIILFDNNETRL